MSFTAIDGPPGTGKTRTVVAEAEAATGGRNVAVVTYTRDAAAVVQKRSPFTEAGTVYSLTWPYAKSFGKVKGGHGSRNESYSRRRVRSRFDQALHQYANDAPSMKAPHPMDEAAKRLHGWRGGESPVNLSTQSPAGQIKFALPLARWLEAGAPMPRAHKYDLLLIDEAQDMSWLELRAALAMVAEDGIVRAFGDPGQAIFTEAKGGKGTSMPPAWVYAEELGSFELLDKGYRVGDPVASTAAKVLRSWYDRPASTFCAEHGTSMRRWNPEVRPRTGLVLGYSRRMVASYFSQWDLRNSGVLPKVANADSELVLSTGHAAKGAQADDVYLLPWSIKALKRLEQKEPATLRLLYVMMTRARRRLHVPPQLYARLL